MQAALRAGLATFLVSRWAMRFDDVEDHMQRFLWAPVVVSLALVAGPAFADVTIKMSSSYKGRVVNQETSTVTFIKRQKMRADVKSSGQDTSAFVDAVTKQQVLVNHVTKQVQDLTAPVASGPVSYGDATLSFKPTGQTKKVLGRVCAGYTFEVSVVMTIQDEALTMTLAGQVWIAHDGPGVTEYMEVQKALAGAGLKVNPVATATQNKAHAELNAVIAGYGIPMEQAMRITVTGTSQLGQLMGQAFNTQVVSKVTAMSVDTVPDDLFAVPAGYTKK